MCWVEEVVSDCGGVGRSCGWCVVGSRGHEDVWLAKEVVGVSEGVRRLLRCAVGRGGREGVWWREEVVRMCGGLRRL